MNMFNHFWLKNVNKIPEARKRIKQAIYWARGDGENNNGDYMLNFRWNKLLKNQSNLTTNSTRSRWEEEPTLVLIKGLLNF